MSIRASASGVINAPTEDVWQLLRDFSFPSKVFTSIASLNINDGAHGTEVGATRVITWQGGAWRAQRLLALSDLAREATWETVAAEPPLVTTAILTTIRLTRISQTNQCLLTWSSEFSADVTPAEIQDEQKAYLQNIVDIQSKFPGKGHVGSS